MATLYYVPAETRRWLKKARDAVETLLSANSFDVAAADALAHRTVYPPVELPMPAFGNEPLSLELQHGDAASPVEYLCFDANEKFPDHFAAMWHAGRDRYRKILAACPARNFLVYDVHHKTDGPMAIYEMRGEAPFKYAKVAEAVASDGECGSFAATCHGIFDDPPSPEVLAFLLPSCGNGAVVGVGAAPIRLRSARYPRVDERYDRRASRHRRRRKNVSCK